MLQRHGDTRVFVGPKSVIGAIATARHRKSEAHDNEDGSKLVSGEARANMEGRSRR